MAVFDWDSIRQAENYTRTADQVWLAAEAMHFLDSTPGRDEAPN
jgi:hypothetical protein